MLRTIRAVNEADKCALEISYYPEADLKSLQEKIVENKLWAKQFGEANKFYTLYGLDKVGADGKKYMDYYHFMTSRNTANQLGKIECQIALLRDKFIFFKYMKSCGLPVPEVFAVIRNQKLYDLDFNERTWDYLVSKKDYFVKAIDGGCASFVKHVNVLNIREKLIDTHDFGSYILQERVIQNDSMDILNPNALNTYRIVTINKYGKVYLLSGILRVGTSKTGNVDNWAAGGLAIGIQESGYLKEYGFFKPTFGTKINIHPDTKIKFSEFKAPQYKEAVDFALNAHKFFYGVRAIGWDIAISDKGPVFIEGNDNWEISLNQACDRPLRKDWEEVIAE